MNSTLNVSATPELAKTYSPLTLGLDWPKMGRLLFLIGCSTLGTFMNGFFVSSFFVENSLRKLGNVFLACAGLADLIITSGVIPTCAVVLLSGQWDIDPVCYALHFLAESATYCYSLFSMLVAIESYYRICGTSREYQMFLSIKVSLVSVLVFVIGFSMAGVGVFLDFDYDYCRRFHYGNFYFRVATSAIFHGVPFIVTMFCLIIASVHVRRRARKQIQYRRSKTFERDSSVTALNITAYVYFVLSWTPYLVIVHEFPNTSDAKFYHCVWIGLSRSVIISFLYACFNRNFRRAFAHLFNYCCCKSTLSSSFNSRHRRTLDYRPTFGDIRVHILHRIMNFNSSSRAGSSSREIHDL